MLRKIVPSFVIVLALIVAMSAISMAQSEPDTIKIGYAVSFSGEYVPGTSITVLPNYRLWAEQVNADGGIFLSKYGRKVPVELIEYDDRSEVETAVRLTERMMVQDKLDFVLPPWGTALQAALAPIYNRHGYPMMAAVANSTKVKQEAAKWPYAFWFLPTPEQMTVPLIETLAALRDEGKVGNKVAILYVADLHGIEMAGGITPHVPTHGFDLVYYKSYPLGISDLTPQLQELKRLDPDIFIAFSYPADTMMLADQAAIVGFNPTVFYTSVGTAFPVYINRFGSKAEGVLGAGGVLSESAAATAYREAHRASQGADPDWWASYYVYASLQVLQQAIEQVGEIDRAKIRDAIDTGTFDTIIGPVQIEDQFNTQHPSFVGQWQGGLFKGITDPADMVIPKPEW